MPTSSRHTSASKPTANGHVSTRFARQGRSYLVIAQRLNTMGMLALTTRLAAEPTISQLSPSILHQVFDDFANLARTVYTFIHNTKHLHSGAEEAFQPHPHDPVAKMGMQSLQYSDAVRFSIVLLKLLEALEHYVQVIPYLMSSRGRSTKKMLQAGRLGLLDRTFSAVIQQAARPPDQSPKKARSKSSTGEAGVEGAEMMEQVIQRQFNEGLLWTSLGGLLESLERIVFGAINLLEDPAPTEPPIEFLRCGNEAVEYTPVVLGRTEPLFDLIVPTAIVLEELGDKEMASLLRQLASTENG